MLSFHMLRPAHDLDSLRHILVHCLPCAMLLQRMQTPGPHPDLACLLKHPFA